MALSINNHSLLTTSATASTTGTLTAAVGDLATAIVYTSTASVTAFSVTGGGLTWSLVDDQTNSVARFITFTAPTQVVVAAQTITVTMTGATIVGGALLSITNGLRIGKPTVLGNLGTSSLTRSITTTNNGSLVVGVFTGSTDTLISAPATALDNNGANTASATAGGPFLAGVATSITATSAGGSLTRGYAVEIIGNKTRLNNSGLRPHPFSPGLAR